MKNLKTDQLATLLDIIIENNIVSRDKATLKEIYQMRFQGGLGLYFLFFIFSLPNQQNFGVNYLIPRK